MPIPGQACGHDANQPAEIGVTSRVVTVPGEDGAAPSNPPLPSVNGRKSDLYNAFPVSELLSRRPKHPELVDPSGVV